MICEFENPLIINDTTNGEFVELENYQGNIKDSVILWNNLNCPEAGATSELIQQDNQELYFKNEITTGQFLITSVILFLIIINFIDLIERRFIPRFVRFWK